jgi:hypothetical protein
MELVEHYPDFIFYQVPKFLKKRKIETIRPRAFISVTTPHYILYFLQCEVCDEPQILLLGKSWKNHPI